MNTTFEMKKKNNWKMPVNLADLVTFASLSPPHQFPVVVSDKADGLRASK